MARTRWLNRREQRAWRGYLRMRMLLDLEIGRDLARWGLSDADYQVLVYLSETDGHRLRMIDMAQRMLWSKSRLAHHLDRMAARGLVRRETHPTNSRATVVALTEEGLDTIRTVAPDHVTAVRRHFVDLLTKEQLDVLGDATQTVVDHLTRLGDPDSDRSDGG